MDIKISGQGKERGCGNEINSENLSQQSKIKDLKHDKKMLKYMTESYRVHKIIFWIKILHRIAE